VVFSAASIYLFTESPDFGLSMSITLCLSELVNGILKLYSVRPRPLWVSSALRRKGSTWEKVRNPRLSVSATSFEHCLQDSSFPSSHAQAIMTMLSVFLLEGQKAFPPFTLKVIVWVLAVLTFLTGFSRAYLALHYVSDVSDSIQLCGNCDS
jgi:membrane-associated phospholipid phosphatase